MSGLTRSDVFGRSLKIHNSSNNILEMDLQGNLFLNNNSIQSNIKSSISLNSLQDINLTTKNTGSLTLNSNNGDLVIRNGDITTNSLSYAYENVNVDEVGDSYNYFDGNSITNPYNNTADVLALRNNSFLIESIGSKALTLYSNNGINCVSHGNITSVCDNNFIIQSNRKINLTSLGYISFNSERLVSSVEEDTSFFSSTGNIILGGNGITNNGLMVNSNQNNNFTGFGKTENANRSVDIEINHPSNDNTQKNGIIVTNSNNSQNQSSVPINPEIELGNSNTNIKFDMGIGAEYQDVNLRVVAKKVNIDNKTYLVTLNNFTFNNTDLGKTVTWNDSTNFSPSIILKIVNDTSANNYGIMAQINSEQTSQITAFNFQIGYINRNNFGYLKTKTASGISLGTNNKHYFNVTKTGNIGINTETPDGSFQIKNTYGNTFNNNIVPTNTYTNGKMIQLGNGNKVLISNSKTGSNYSLMGFIYDDSDSIISNFTIVSDSVVEIQFGLDNLVDENDLFVVAYCYRKNNSSSNLVYFTESNVFKNNGTLLNNNLKREIEHDSNFPNSSYPNVKGFKFDKDNLNVAGYALTYNDLVTSSTADTLVHSFVEIYINKSPGNILATRFDITEDLFPSGTGATSKLNSEIVNTNIDSMINKYIGIEVNDDTNSILVVNYSRIEIDTSNIYHHTYLQRFILSISGTTYSLTRNNFGSSFFLDLKVHTASELNVYKTYKLEGASIRLIQTNTSTDPVQKIYAISFYEKNTSGVKQKIHLAKVTLKTNYQFDLSISEKGNLNNETAANTLITDVPNVSRKEEGIYLLGWVHVNDINYLQSNLSGTTTVSNTITSSGAQQIFVLCTNDLTGIYKDSIILWNNNNSSDTINNLSITLKKILSNFNIFSVKNDNIDFKLTNEGEFTLTNSDKVTLNESLEIDKNNNKVSILTGKNLVITSNDDAGTATAGVEGQLNYKGEKLYIYLNSQWKEISLS